MDPTRNCLLLASIFLILFAGISNGQENPLCRHYELAPVQNFSMDMILGNWIPFKSYAALSEDAVSNVTCLEANLVPYDSFFPFGLETSFFIENEAEQVHEAYAVVPDRNNTAVWAMAGPIDVRLHITHTVYTHTDYDNYAVQYTCEVIGEGEEAEAHEKMIIWTRTWNPNSQLISLLEVIVEDSGFSLDNEIPIDQSNCEM